MQFKTKQKAYIYLLITTATWGSLFVSSKVILDSIPPFTLLFLRYFIAVIVLFFIYKKGNHQKLNKGDYKNVIAIGFLGHFLGVGLQLVGTDLCDASLAALINSMNPVILILLAIPILKERVTFHKIIAIAATLIGTVIIIGNVKGGSEFLGVLISIGSVIAWSLYSVLIRRFSVKYDSLTMTFYGMLTAAVLSFPFGVYSLMKEQITLSVITPNLVANVLYIGVFCTAFVLLLWNKALSMVDAATCSLFYPVQPLVATLMGIILLSEVITANFIIGGVCIIGGILYAVMMESKVTKEIHEGNTQDVP